MRRMLRSLSVRFLLVFALLFAQQGAVLHAASHILADHSQDQSKPNDKHCDLCAAYAQIGSAIGVSTISFNFTEFFAKELTTLFTSYYSFAFTAFAARAPPLSA